MYKLMQTIKQVFTIMFVILKKTTMILLALCLYILLFIYLPGTVIFFVFKGIPDLGSAIFVGWLFIVIVVSVREVLDNYMK